MILLKEIKEYYNDSNVEESGNNLLNREGSYTFLLNNSEDENDTRAGLLYNIKSQLDKANYPYSKTESNKIIYEVSISYSNKYNKTKDYRVYNCVANNKGEIISQSLKVTDDNLYFYTNEFDIIWEFVQEVYDKDGYSEVINDADDEEPKKGDKYVRTEAYRGYNGNLIYTKSFMEYGNSTPISTVLIDGSTVYFIEDFDW